MALQYSSILVSICVALMCQKVFARIDYGPYVLKPEIPAVIEDYGIDSEEYVDAKNMPEQNPNFLKNWPYLRDMIPPEYEGSTNRNHMLINPPYVEMSEMLPTPQPQKGHPSSRVNDVKEYLEAKNRQQKKNSNSRPHYMSACHFKICNLGRKRNVRFVNL